MTIAPAVANECPYVLKIHSGAQGFFGLRRDGRDQKATVQAGISVPARPFWRRRIVPDSRVVLGKMRRSSSLPWWVWYSETENERTGLARICRVVTGILFDNMPDGTRESHSFEVTIDSRDPQGKAAVRPSDCGE